MPHTEVQVAGVAATPGTHLDRDQILQATSLCLHESGYDNTTIRRIAKQLNCAVGSIYRYFRDKRELLFAVTQQMLEPVARLIESGGAFDHSAALYYERAFADRASYRLMFWLASLGEGEKPGQKTGAQAAAPSGAPSGARQLDSVSNDLTPPIVARIVRGWATRLGDEATARTCWAMLHGCITLGFSADATREQLQRLIGGKSSARPSPPLSERAAASPSADRSSASPVTAATLLTANLRSSPAKPLPAVRPALPYAVRTATAALAADHAADAVAGASGAAAASTQPSRPVVLMRQPPQPRPQPMPSDSVEVDSAQPENVDDVVLL